MFGPVRPRAADGAASSIKVFTMLKKIILTALGLIVIVGVLGGIKGLQIAALIALSWRTVTLNAAPARRHAPMKLRE